MWVSPLPPPSRGGCAVDGHRHPPGPGPAGGGRAGCRVRGAGRHLLGRCGRLRPLCPRRGRERRHAGRPFGRYHRGRRQQPARRNPPRDGAHGEGRALRARLRHQCRRLCNVYGSSTGGLRSAASERRARRTGHCSVSSRPQKKRGCPPTRQRTAWPSSASSSRDAFKRAGSSPMDTLRQTDPELHPGDRRGGSASGRPAGDDRERELRVACGSRGHGNRAHQQVRGGPSRPPLLRRVRGRRRGGETSPGTEPRSCSGRTTPTCRRTPGRRRTWPATSPSCRPATASWG